MFLAFSCGLAGKESACNGRDLGLIPGLRRPAGEGKGYPLQFSGLENSMDYGKELDMTEPLSLSFFISPNSTIVTPAQTSPLNCRLFSCLPNIFTYNCKFNMNFCFFLLKEPALPLSSHSQWQWSAFHFQLRLRTLMSSLTFLSFKPCLLSKFGLSYLPNISRICQLLTLSVSGLVSLTIILHWIITSTGFSCFSESSSFATLLFGKYLLTERNLKRIFRFYGKKEKSKNSV